MHLSKKISSASLLIRNRIGEQVYFYEMGVDYCEIRLDNPSAIYIPGQTVKGKVVFNFEKVKSLKKISVTFEGKAFTKWRLYQNHNYKIYKGFQLYFKHNFLIVNGINNSIVKLKPGIHLHKISCNLPTDLPPSYTGSKGSVIYSIKVKFKYPWKISQKFYLQFSVINPINILLDRKYLEPVSLQIKKTFSSFLSKKGILELICKIPRTGYIPGQNIPVKIDIKNGTHFKINEIQIKLMEIVTYKAFIPNQNIKIEQIPITTAKIKIIIHPKSCSSYHQCIAVPYFVPSKLINCDIIDVNYELHVIIKTTGSHENMFCKIPVVIGTSKINSSCFVIYEKLLQQVNIPSPYTLFHSDFVAPPSYDDCILETCNIFL